MFAAALIVLSATWLTVISGLVIPVLTGLVTKYRTTYGVKSVVTVTLAAIAGVVNSIVQNDGILSTDTLIAAGTSWGIALAFVFGIVGPFDLDSKLLPGIGVGRDIYEDMVDPAP